MSRVWCVDADCVMFVCLPLAPYGVREGPRKTGCRRKEVAEEGTVRCVCQLPSVVFLLVVIANLFLCYTHTHYTVPIPRCHPIPSLTFTKTCYNSLLDPLLLGAGWFIGFRSFDTSEQGNPLQGDPQCVEL